MVYVKRKLAVFLQFLQFITSTTSICHEKKGSIPTINEQILIDTSKVLSIKHEKKHGNIKNIKLILKNKENYDLLKFLTKHEIKKFQANLETIVILLYKIVDVFVESQTEIRNQLSNIIDLLLENCKNLTIKQTSISFLSSVLNKMVGDLWKLHGDCLQKNINDKKQRIVCSKFNKALKYIEKKAISQANLIGNFAEKKDLVVLIFYSSTVENIIQRLHRLLIYEKTYRRQCDDSDQGVYQCSVFTCLTFNSNF